VAIPEASPSMSNARRGKRRASEADVEVAQKLKGLRRLGTKVTFSPIPLSPVIVCLSFLILRT
jgi:hypothetical protein